MNGDEEDDGARRRRSLLIIVVLLALVGLYWMGTFNAPDAGQTITYDQLLDRVEAGEVEKAELRETEIVAQLKTSASEPKGKTVSAKRLPGVDEEFLVTKMREQDVELTGKAESQNSWGLLLLWVFLPLILMYLVLWWLMRRMRQRGGPLSVGKANAKLYDQSAHNRVTFDDVAGVDEAKEELMEVVKFLRDPTPYVKLGARIPKGVLLVGPPGTGKTLLAKAVAGESGVPFFSMSGPSFVEMFVGVGAARMRSLFEQATARAPCIVFIDEIDAVGKSRGGAASMSGNDEREQTLDQLLSEMDGFEPNNGVVIMAATNRPEVLDQALLRAGRFDRQVVVDRPDLAGRRAILGVHIRPVRYADDVDLDTIARRTPGMAGADLANIVNEAALAGARRGADAVEMRDFEEAIDRVQLGLKKRSAVMSPQEKRRVAFHESGHALVAMSVEHSDPVHRVSIIPRSIGALGVTLQLPTEERYLMTRAELTDRIAVMLGGRVAEELACDDISTGAQDDLERATELARQMVCRFGMSEELGPATWGRPMRSRFLQPGLGMPEDRNFSEATGQRIDAEVSALISAQQDRARKLLTEKRDLLRAMAERLLDHETLSQPELEAILRGEELPRPLAEATERDDEAVATV